MTQATPLAPFYPAHRLGTFAGWSLPLFFQGVLAEHTAVRTQVGMFDISHMGKFQIHAALPELEQLVPSHLAPLAPGTAQYTLLLNHGGKILDDVIFYRQAEEQWRVIVNGATCSQDYTWIHNRLLMGTLKDESADQVLIALQGPQAETILQTLCDQDLSLIPRFGHGPVMLDGHPAWLARTGYTGEDGFEIMLSNEDGITLWQVLLTLGVPPCGLGARDSLRLEAAMHLYGQDMDQTTNPLEAGLGWVIAWDKGEFIGREALAEVKGRITRKLVGLEVLGRGIARPGYPILHEGQNIGTVTSGGPSPTLQRNFALGYVPAALAKIGTPLAIQIRNQEVSAVVVKRPFYRR